MKNNRIIVALFVLFLWMSLPSCKKDTIDVYQQQAGVYFNDNVSKYSFVEHANRIEIGYDIVNIPVSITGSATDNDRTFRMEFVKDTVHTAEEGMITMEGDGIVKAGKYGGSIALRVNYSKLLDDSIYVAKLKIIPTEDFQILNLNDYAHTISFGNIFSQPENWYALRTYFGSIYSNSWYRFILETVNLPSIPYKYSLGAEEPLITPEEAEKWPMNVHEVKTLAAKVRIALAEYNNANPENQKVHEDGPRKGTLITMPKM